jgi:hypothetical protein
MEDRFYGVSRWLVALTVVFIPLSVIMLVSGVWGYNVQLGLNQWTRYLLFVSWVLLTISLIAGISNLITPPLEEEAEGKAGSQTAMKAEKDEEGGDDDDKPVEEVNKKRNLNVGYALLLTQAGTFLMGVIVYVVYISWMILPYINIPKTTGY